ncbi:uncharacterized protein LOC126908693 isoform X2 [Daktulosphaira vitifoliae]|uniref:uncharacterized protein LOC126908693 isoform X2 n=1 Tax=Daktulosphaira vitifoliae TaxID=58002 RepID=UPI0021A9FC3C|nr:uncharacterized protein LOC126908693 isoform X2 [Daktulosphaira vitifoliae]
MFYKIYTFLLIFMCGHFFEEVFGNILLINPEEVILDNRKQYNGYHTEAMWITGEHFKRPSNKEIIVYDSWDKTVYYIDAKWIIETYSLKPSKKYLMCGPLILDFENKNEIFAELYVNFTFEKENIILNYKGNDNYFEYNVEEMNLKLKSFIRKINKLLLIRIIKIQSSKLDNNTSLINDTVYDKHTGEHLRRLEDMSLWKYVEEELIQSYVFTTPNTTIYDFILNSTMYGIAINFTLKEAIRIMCDRTFKYAILLMLYAYEALRIDYCKTLYWDQLIKNLIKLSDVLIKLNYDNELLKGLQELKKGRHEREIMSTFQKLVNKYVNIFLTPREIKMYDVKTNISSNNNNFEHILSQIIIDKILKGFPKPCEDNEPYKFELICEIEGKFQKIFKLIDTEFKIIHRIEFYNIF